MIGVGFQSGTAAARPDDSTNSANVADRPAARTISGAPDRGALPVKLSPAQRAELIREADAAKGEAAQDLKLGAKEKLVVKDVIKDADGTTHTRYERTYAGLPVLGGDLVVDRAKSGAPLTVAKATKARLTVPTTSAAVAPAAAEKAAVRAANAQGSRKTAADRAPRKVIWAAKGTPALAYETVVGGLQEDGTPNELHVISDAATGKKLFEFQGVKKGTGNSQYSGQVALGTSGSSGSYNLTDSGRGNHKTYNLNRGTSGTGTLFTDTDDVWGNGTTSDAATAGVDAHYGAAETWDYYKNVHGRTGIRGDGVGAYSRVHYSSGYVNAFWQDACFCMTYGDGSGNAKPLTSIDVAAHEMSHGVTAATANLTYSGESGGLNEGTSDIFAAAVEFYANNASDPGDYLVGEKIDINGNGTPLRYMDKPSKDGTSKDSWYSGVGNVDVHYSSGIANHFFYLLSEGSGAKVINGVSYNSPTYDNLPVTGIGRDNAEKIWFKALSQRMTSNTNYAGARDATLWAAGELFGQASPQYNAVANAWAGVNVGTRIADGVTVTPPGDQTSIVNQATSLQITATSSNPGALSYAAGGLPAGLAIDSSSGLVSGTPTTVGSSPVTVTVTDSAGKTGTASFTWTVNTSGGNVFENTADIAIPDAGEPVTSPISVSRAGNAPSNLQVGVDIVHTYRGDLVIDLVAPDGTAYRLKDASLFDSADDVRTTYTVDASSETAVGTWKLRVQDMYAQDTGYINSWKLTF
ncbi:M4 family metallopeptidase [Streptomyces rugosispiralis]|uniref:M4 family metallopeptidase n=1 Tax=Streptomyces rugosispiralis TaxID=2967341 RepID=A0ABT1UWP0_9ACTN|nr:M4 family metallopeptidase [Streptomyces rugosispiralis]MCQ8189548.1 M4 family metallopeptidase [Streptomyces rugosispiralis]